MNADDIIRDLKRIIASLPANPVAPENRNVARLMPSPWVAPGQMYRMLPDKMFWEEDGNRERERPRILINDRDLMALRTAFTGQFGTPSDQLLADIAEQLFAEQEAKQQ